MCQVKTTNLNSYLVVLAKTKPKLAVKTASNKAFYKGNLLKPQKETHKHNRFSFTEWKCSFLYGEQEGYPLHSSFKTNLKSILDTQIHHRWRDNMKIPHLKLLRIYDAGNIDR